MSNNITIVGKIACDEPRITKNGETTFAEYSIADNIWSKSKKKEHANFYKFTLINDSYLNRADWLGKGSEIMIDGVFMFDTYEKSQGAGKGYHLEILNPTISYTSGTINSKKE